MKYADAVYGNLAYDIPLKRPAEVPEAQSETQTDAYAEQRARIKQQTKAAPKQALSVFAIAGGVCIAVLMVLIVLSHISLSDVSEQTVALTAQMEELTAAEAKLQIQYESAFDLNEVERYAMSELGMVKAGEHQVRYITNEVADKAVILEVEDDGGLLGALQRFFDRISEYFR